jgi:methionyl-tRNA formyltransferase
MRIVFMGTPDFAVPTLVELAGGGGEIVAVYTRAPKTAGRGMAERRSPVHEAAERLRLSVLHPHTLKDEAAAKTFRAMRADVAVVVAYGLILPKPILDTPKFGCLNIHASLLPRWRGAAPIARAIMAGDAETGISIMRIEEGLDTGPVALTERVPIAADATAGQLHDRLAGLGAARMSLALAALADDALEFKPQPEAGVTYAKKIDKGETRIDWSRPWKEVHDHIRGLSPFPGAWFEIGGNRVRALGSTHGEGAGKPGTVLDDRLTVACGEGAVRLVDVQRAGARAMSVEEFLRGTPIPAGTVLA